MSTCKDRTKIIFQETGLELEELQAIGKIYYRFSKGASERSWKSLTFMTLTPFPKLS